MQRSGVSSLCVSTVYVFWCGKLHHLQKVMLHKYHLEKLLQSHLIHKHLSLQLTLVKFPFFAASSKAASPSTSKKKKRKKKERKKTRTLNLVCQSHRVERTIKFHLSASLPHLCLHLLQDQEEFVHHESFFVDQLHAVQGKKGNFT